MPTAKPVRRRPSCRSLRYPDAFYVRGAEGWLDLGNPQEALAELERVSRSQCLHPDVRFMRWRIFAIMHCWQRCFSIARMMTKSSPNDPRSWIALCRSLRQLGKLEEAYSIVIVQSQRFSTSWELLYDGACYACLLGNIKEAAYYLRRAMAVGDSKAIRLCALQDPELEQLTVA